MANMSYCRFENTVSDMQDCIENMDSFDRENSSDDEVMAFDRFIELCCQVARDYADMEYTDEDEDEETTVSVSITIDGKKHEWTL